MHQPGRERRPWSDQDHTGEWHLRAAGDAAQRLVHLQGRKDRHPDGACPNPMWTANVVEVEFGDATLTLREGNTISDTITVPVS